MVNTPKNANVNNAANVNTNIRSNNVGLKTLRNRRKRQRRAARRAANVLSTPAISNKFTNMDTLSSGLELMELQDMNRGRMTSDPSSDITFIRSITSKCFMDENTEGWFFKYLDPAGAVETGRAVGEFSKIPDGLLTFSVDAEIRTIDTLPVPLIEEETGGSGIPLDGATWSLTIFSYPMFRTAYIAIANRFDKELSTNITSELAYELNNLLDYRYTIDLNTWIPFAITLEAGWFYWIKPLPPTYNLPDPVAGDQRTLTSWRMSYKSLTLEHNAPTLIDQGFWNGAHYALDPAAVQQIGQQTEMIPSYVHARANETYATASAARFSIRIPNLPQLTSITGPAALVLTSDSLYFNVTGDNSGSGTIISWVVPSGTAMYNPFDGIFAAPGDTVSVTSSFVTATGSIITFTSSNTASVSFSITLPISALVVVVGTEAQFGIFVDNDLNVFTGRTSQQIEFPAYTPAQIAANNPKQEQFLMKETNGAYVVHKKMRKPVFELTPSSSYGPIQFTTPDYDIKRNNNDGSGILDSFDSNFSTAVIAVRGIAHANVPVIKLYQGWEGVTNVNTPFGQFGHTGLARSDCVMQLVDNLTVRTTGVYPANDNFLGLIAKFAAGALRSLLSSQATPTVLGNLAQGVINKGVLALRNRLNKSQQSRVARAGAN